MKVSNRSLALERSKLGDFRNVQVMLELLQRPEHEGDLFFLLGARVIHYRL